ncbi:hypothetical protein [Gilliamella apicola]|uniref:Uncharacterized protein n=1 Tax=Gilliamella apicola TaxID=1196095 RepID=A0A242NES5_9GAMM|nr:hypothetical protein [Gilliamella apicola]OTP82416.1 hypothetical protein B5S40_07145 [Gilliamella apicola]OTP84517.1 hypothetical protein B5S44_09685 [Gilliamella apicola]OTP86933.1 hypothetical protein B5S42_11950 [Gilliamella apicola]OTP98326.1 hypothetical protein B6D08_11325 [Gilliamella apicola]OTQ09404.1 hypothetical protein B6D11_13530 [Gilliamella apicola]
MKRIALLGLVCFALSGCGDDGGGKVTNEFLVGKWDCVQKEYKSSYDSKFEEYSDYVESRSEQIIQSFKVVNGVLLLKTGDEEVEPVDLDEVYNNLKMEGKDYDQEYVINRNLVKNSSNKFTYEMEMFSTHQGDKIDVTKSKTKLLRVCTKAK